MKSIPLSRCGLRRYHGFLAVLAALLFAPAWAHAQAVALAGMLGSKALLVVDGSAPRAVAAGEEHKGVQVVSVGREEAVVLVGGERRMLRLGESPVSLRSAATRVVLQPMHGGTSSTRAVSMAKPCSTWWTQGPAR